MDLSPIDLRQQQFRTAFRGFDKMEVASFLLMVADHYEQALRETERLRHDVARLEALVNEYRQHERSVGEIGPQSRIRSLPLTAETL